MNRESIETAIREKLETGGVNAAGTNAFLNAARQALDGVTGLLAEADIEPVDRLPSFEELPEPTAKDNELFGKLAVIKLNGGLGTGMGLDRAKSLLKVKGERTFLDFIAEQILGLRGDNESGAPAFYLMNSFATQQDTLDYLEKYPALPDEEGTLDFLQSRAPKLLAESLEPVSWPENPDLEWCPPGHGDIYPSLLASGLLDRLLDQGILYAFVSNSDNLGATMDLHLLKYLAESGLSFFMEVVKRTPSDSKGGHLARRKSDDHLILRESAQCPEEDQDAFQDISRHKFFNSNNLWIRLDRLKEHLAETGGALALPTIRNLKTVDPKNPDSPKVLQLETAMGAAIECFGRTGAVVIPRSRFAPVKTTSDLLAIRSDAYEITEDHRLVLIASRNSQPPTVQLDKKLYKLVEDLDAAFPNGAPSLARCDSLKIEGPVRFEAHVVLEGNVEILNTSSETQVIQSGMYKDQTLRF